jgi:hypothetical protein
MYHCTTVGDIVEHVILVPRRVVVADVAHRHFSRARHRRRGAQHLNQSMTVLNRELRSYIFETVVSSHIDCRISWSISSEDGLPRLGIQKQCSVWGAFAQFVRKWLPMPQSNFPSFLVYGTCQGFSTTWLSPGWCCLVSILSLDMFQSHVHS